MFEAARPCADKGLKTTVSRYDYVRLIKSTVEQNITSRTMARRLQRVLGRGAMAVIATCHQYIIEYSSHIDDKYVQTLCLCPLKKSV